MYFNNMISFLIQNMTIPDTLLQASVGVGTSSVSARDQAEKHRIELENYRQELLAQIDTGEFRSKNQNE